MKTFQAHYQNQEFQKALVVLQKGEPEIPPGLWHYNLGTVFAKLEQLPLSRFHFLKARSHGFRDAALHHNLNLVEESLEVPRLEKAQGIHDYLVKGGVILSGDLLMGLSLALLVLSLVLVKKLRRKRSAWSLLFLFVFPLLLNWWIESWPRALTISTVEVLDGPSTIFESRAEVPPGVRLFYSVNGDWARVHSPARFAGWVKLQNLQPLE